MTTDQLKGRAWHAGYTAVNAVRWAMAMRGAKLHYLGAKRGASGTVSPGTGDVTAGRLLVRAYRSNRAAYAILADWFHEGKLVKCHDGLGLAMWQSQMDILHADGVLLAQYVPRHLPENV